MSGWTVVFPNLETTPAGLELEPVRVSHNDRGGCHEAVIKVMGRLEDTQFCTDWLGRRVRILNDVGSTVWWGVVTGVTVGLGKWAVGRSLEGLVNRCAVEYSAEDRTSGDNYAVTAWLDDTDSQALYGVREHLVSLGDGNANEANAKRSTVIAQAATPATVRSRTAGEGATLVCWGLIRFLEWQYYENLVGRIEHDGDDAEEMSIGWELTSSEIGFWETAVHDLGAGLGGLHVGDKFIVAGSDHNDGEWYVAENTDREAASLTASTISFLSNDDVYDSADGFGRFETKAFVHIAGSPANSGYHAIDGKPDDGYMTTKQSFTAAIVNESAGASVTIRQGNKVATTAAITNEVAGDAASVNIKLVGFQIGQSFVAPATMTLNRVAVKVGKVGSPIDSLHVRLYSDSGGSPGTWLDTATIAAADLEEDSTDWIWGTWATGISITATATYWLLLARSGTNDETDYYLASLVGGAYGSTKAWNNATWSALSWLPSGAVSMPFQLWDSEDTSAAIARIVTNCGGSFVTATTISATGVERNQWAEDGARGNHELTKLLDIGTSAGLRLVCEVNEQGTLVVTTETAEPTDTLTLPRYGDDDRIVQHNGAMWQSGMSAAGQWLNLTLPMGIGQQWDISPVYVRKSEYDVNKGVWALTFGDSDMLSSYRGT